MNALDDKKFHEIVNHFPDGEIVIVNEGLLMYLNINEKKRLCSIIYDILKERGSYWITADIYIRNKNDKLNLRFDNKTTEFFEQHRIEDNKFESFKEAETFFRQMGLVIDKEANVKRSKLSSMKYFLKSTTIRQISRCVKLGKFSQPGV